MNKEVFETDFGRLIQSNAYFHLAECENIYQSEMADAFANGEYADLNDIADRLICDIKGFSDIHSVDDMCRTYFALGKIFGESALVKALLHRKDAESKIDEYEAKLGIHRVMRPFYLHKNGCDIRRSDLEAAVSWSGCVCIDEAKKLVDNAIIANAIEYAGGDYYNPCYRLTDAGRRCYARWIKEERRWANRR